MKTIEVKVGNPSKFYNKGKRINLDTAFGMYQKGAKFAVNGKKLNLNKFGAGMDDIPDELYREIAQYAFHPMVDIPQPVVSYKGNFKIVEFLNENGQRHRLGGPAETYYLKDEAGNWTVKHRESWFKNDQLHREDGPAVIEYYNDGVIKSEGWWENNRLRKWKYRR